MGNFIENDGGRNAAGYKGQTRDCVTRSIAIASGLSYQYVYDEMAAGNAEQRKTRRTGPTSGRRSASNGIYTSRKWFKDWMAAHGFRWVSTMQIGSGCKVHLSCEELPAGRLVVAVSKHYTTMIDGIVHDTFDPSRGGTRCVYGYWIFEGGKR